MKRFEYKTIEIKPNVKWKSWFLNFNIDEVDAILNELGSQGWELVTVDSRDMGGTVYGFLYTFKREV